MIGAKLIGIASPVVAGGTLAAVAAPAQLPPAAEPAMFDLLGVGVPILPVLIGVLTAALVRVIIISSSPNKQVGYNIAIMALVMLGTASFITDHKVSAGMSFWVGCSFGAVGVGIIQIAKSKLFAALLDGIKAGLTKGMTDDQTPQP